MHVDIVDETNIYDCEWNVVLMRSMQSIYEVHAIDKSDVPLHYAMHVRHKQLKKKYIKINKYIPSKL